MLDRQFLVSPQWGRPLGILERGQWPPNAPIQRRNSDMEDNKSKDKQKSSSRWGSELGVVSIDFNPGPDAQDRLRRLFTLLIKLADDDQLDHGTDSSSAESGEDDA